MINFSSIQERPVFRTVMLFIVIFCVALILIILGRRNDAITQAQIYQAGVVTADEVNTAFETVGGKLIKRHVDESDIVKKGDLLLEINDADLKNSLASINAQIAAMDAQIEKQKVTIANETSRLNTTTQKTYRQIEQLQANINSAKSALDRNSREYKRYENLSKEKAISVSNLDSAKNDYLNSKFSLEALEKNLAELTVGASKEQLTKLRQDGIASNMTLNSINESKKDVENLTNVLNNLIASRDALISSKDQIELNLSRTKLYAPCDGKVLEVLYQEGEMVNANSTAVVIETDKHYYDVYISEKVATRYKAGDKVTGYAVALDKDVDGTVRFVQASPSFADIRMTREQGQADLTSYKMRIYVDVKTDPDLLVGMTVEVKND